MDSRSLSTLCPTTFAVYVAEHLPLDVDATHLEAALAAVRLRPKQEGSKLSPVVKIPNASGRPSILPIAPYCASGYSSFATCPTTCSFFGEHGGCFVGANPNQRRCTDKLDEAALRIPEQMRRDLIALAEAWKIANLFKRVPQDGRRGGRDLRIHVAGDVTSAFHAERLAEAVAEWERRGGGTAFTFTHSGLVIPRRAFGGTSVLASVEAPADVEIAMERGYAAALVVERFPRGWKAFSLPELPRVTKIRPYPNEAGVISPTTGQAITCVECRMCLDDQRLLEQRHAIAFEVHGRGASDAADSLRRAQKAHVRRSLTVLT